MDSVLFKEFSFSAAGDKVGSESELGGVGFIGGVVTGSAGVVPGVATPGVVGIVVEGLTEVVLDVAVLVVLEAGALEVVGTDVAIDIDLRPNILTQSPFESSQEYPGSQHPSEHWADPGSHRFRHLSVSGTHSVPLGQQKPNLSVHL